MEHGGVQLRQLGWSDDAGEGKRVRESGARGGFFAERHFGGETLPSGTNGAERVRKGMPAGPGQILQLHCFGIPFQTSGTPHVARGRARVGPCAPPSASPAAIVSMVANGNLHVDCTALPKLGRVGLGFFESELFGTHRGIYSAVMLCRGKHDPESQSTFNEVGTYIATAEESRVGRPS